MTAQIIVVHNAKGGVGKTTVAAAVAGALGDRGNQVLVADCDPQGTATAWAAAAEDSRPFPATVVNLSGHGGKVHRELQRHVAHYDYIVIDTPPSLDSAVSSALLVADLALIPLIPAPAELWSAKTSAALIQRASEVNESLRAAILPNRVNRTGLTHVSLQKLSDFGIPVTRTHLSARVAYQEAALEGASIRALGRRGAVANAEIEALVAELLEILGSDQ